MTASQQAKSAGLKSLTQVSQITGVSLNTLINWHRDKPDLFRIVILGCVYVPIKHEQALKAELRAKVKELIGDEK